jgi:DNA-binding response OmpR family regulator
MKKKRILIVDDDETFLEELDNTMQMCGYDTITRTSGKTVVKDADEKRPDVILLDMKINGKSGFQIADDLKHFPSTSDIPIVAMTGIFTERLHRTFMKGLGIDDCVLKPFNPLDIISKIEFLTK